MGVIYMLTCVPNGKSYIGKTIDEKRRIYAHFKGYTKQCKALHNAINKYGKENFTVKILHEGIIPELLADFEIAAIKEYNTKAPNGFNLTDGGEGSLNPSEETLRKRSEKMRGRPQPKEVRDKISASHMGIRPNAETRAKQSAAKKGKPSWIAGKKHTEASRKKMSNTHTGKTIPSKTRQKISATMSKIRTSPHFDSFCDRFQSLPNEMPISEKRQIIRDEYKGILDTQTVWRWTKKLLPPNTDIESRKTYRPEYRDAKEFYFLLPKNMYLAEKRKQLFQKFPDVPKYTLRDWVRKWSNTSTPKGAPRRIEEYTEVHNAFLSLSPKMDLITKRKYLYNKFPEISKSTIYQWVQKWQPTPNALKKSVRRKKAHETFRSFPNNLSLKEKRSILQNKFKDVSTRSIERWTLKWQSELEDPSDEQTKD